MSNGWRCLVTPKCNSLSALSLQEFDVSVEDCGRLIEEVEGPSVRYLYLNGFLSYITSEKFNSWECQRTREVKSPASHARLLAEVMLRCIKI